MELAQPWHDLVANQPPFRVAVRGVDAEVEPCGVAVRLRLLAPDLEQRAHDPVFALRLDRARDAARDESVQDSLDLVARRVPGSAQAVGEEGVANLPQFV